MTEKALVEKFVVTLKKYKNRNVPSGYVWCIDFRRYGDKEVTVGGFLGGHSYTDTEKIIRDAFNKALSDVGGRINDAGLSPRVWDDHG